MKKEVIPIVYQVILSKLLEESYMGSIDTCRARLILGHHFRVGKKNLNKVIIEMKNEGWIEFKNCKEIKLVCDPKQITSIN